MNPKDNKMETVTLIELFQPHLLAEAEAARVSAENALRKIEAEMAAERANMAERYTKLRAEIPTLKQQLRPLEECIRMKGRSGLDGSSDKVQLKSAEARILQMEAEFAELSGKFRPHEDRTQKLVEEATATLNKATEAETGPRPHRKSHRGPRGLPSQPGYRRRSYAQVQNPKGGGPLLLQGRLQSHK